MASFKAAKGGEEGVTLQKYEKLDEDPAKVGMFFVEVLFRYLHSKE